MKPVKADSMKFCSPVALEAKEIEQGKTLKFANCTQNNTRSDFWGNYWMPLMFGPNIKVFPDTELVVGGMPKPKKLPGHYWGLGKVKNVLR